MTVLRILIGDDHAIVRQGLRDILREQAEPAEVGEAGDGLAVLEALKSNQWDLVVLDIVMPRMMGLRALEEIKRLYPKLPVLMLSMHSAAAYVQQSLKLGAAGYLCKESAAEELLIAVEAARAGQIYVSRVLRDTVDAHAMQ
jgi:two-component system, NarL family, invasion response regulator UvrY